MISRILATAILAPLTGGGAFAQVEARAANSPLIVWQGTIFVTAANATCISYGITIGQYGLLVFRPRLNPAEPPTALMIQYGRGNVYLSRTGGAGTDQMRGAATFSGQWVGSSLVPPAVFTGTSQLAFTPVTPTASTDFINLTGTVTNFDGVQNCTVSVRAGLARKP